MAKSAPIVRNRHQQGGPSLQLWGMILPGAMLIVFELPQRGTSAEFMDLIESQVLPSIHDLFGTDFILQQDRAPTHTSAFSKQRFAELGVEPLDWPSRSPDLSIIENCWSLISTGNNLKTCEICGLQSTRPSHTSKFARERLWRTCLNQFQKDSSSALK